MKAKDKIKALEARLEKRSNELSTTRKEKDYFKGQFNKLTSEQALPAVHSESLNVSIFFHLKSAHVMCRSVSCVMCRSVSLFFSVSVYIFLICVQHRMHAVENDKNNCRLGKCYWLWFMCVFYGFVYSWLWLAMGIDGKIKECRGMTIYGYGNVVAAQRE